MMLDAKSTRTQSQAIVSVDMQQGDFSREALDNNLNDSLLVRIPDHLIGFFDRVYGKLTDPVLTNIDRCLVT